MDRQLVIIGNGGHAVSVIASALRAGISIAGYVDKEVARNSPSKLVHLGTDNTYLMKPNYQALHICAIGDNQRRLKIQRKYESDGLEFTNIYHPTSVIEPNIKIGNGVFIGALTYINAEVKIGDGAIINNHVNIEHHCEIQNFAHIAPMVTLTGNVSVGECTLVGANSTVTPGVKISSNCMIGAGSVVLKSVPKNTTLFGNPGRMQVR